MSIEEPQFLAFMRTMFSKYGSDFDLIKEKFYTIYNSSPVERDKLAVYGHFYYFICTPNEKGAREELQIVGITSLIEAMMGDVTYKDPFVYFESEYKGKNSIEDFAKFKNEYFEKYSINKKIVKYFQEYMPQNDTNDILKNIKIIRKNGEQMEPLKNLEELAKFLYQMRSDFVHRAEMRFLCPEHCFASMLEIGDKIYDVRVSISTMLELFEKSFVSFWKNKYELLIAKE